MNFLDRCMKLHIIKGKNEQLRWGSNGFQGSLNLELIHCPFGSLPYRGLGSNLHPTRKALDWLPLLNTLLSVDKGRVRVRGAMSQSLRKWSVTRRTGKGCWTNTADTHYSIILLSCKLRGLGDSKPSSSSHLWSL